MKRTLKPGLILSALVLLFSAVSFQANAQSCIVGTTSLYLGYPSSCGGTIACEDLVNYTPVCNATNYRYEITCTSCGGTDTVVRGYAANSFNFGLYDDMAYNNTYSIRVAAFVSGAWQAFGASCTLSTPAIPAATMTAPFCGTTMTSWGDFFSFTCICGADSAIIEIDGGATTFNVTSKSHTAYMRNMPGVAQNTTYAVRVAVFNNGVQGPFGASCNITTPNLPFLRKHVAPDPLEFNATLSQLTVFPNPSSGDFLLESMGLFTENIQVEIVDLHGKRVYSEQWGPPQEGAFQKFISLPTDLANGIYILSYIHGSDFHTQKLVVE